MAANDITIYDTLFEASFAITGGEVAGTLIEFTDLDGVLTIDGSFVESVYVVSGELEATFSFDSIFRFVYVNKNTFRWSDIGSINFEPDVKNVAGYKVLEWDGVAWKCFKLGKTILVYGSGGVSQMFPISEPVSGYSEKVLTRVGCLNSSSVAANSETHVFVGADFNLYQISHENNATKPSVDVVNLGYKDFIVGLTGNITVSIDAITGVFVISGDNYSLLYVVGKGVTKLNRALTGKMFVGNKWLVPTKTGFIREYFVLLHEFDFGKPGLKTLKQVSFDIDLVDAVLPTCEIYGKVGKSKAFSLIKSCKVTPEGMAFPSVTVSEFQIGLRFTKSSFTQVSLKSLSCAVQFSDRRLLGGMDVKQTDA